MKAILALRPGFGEIGAPARCGGLDHLRRPG